MYQLIEALKKFIDAKKHSENWEKARKDFQAQCVDLWETQASEKDSMELDLVGSTKKVTLVKSETVKIDEEGLREALGEKMWDKITTRKLDNKKLESFVAVGDIDIEVLDTYSEIVPRTPYIKITNVKKSD